MVRNRENIYKRKDGRWEGRYIKGRKESGRLCYGYIYGKTRSELFDRLTEINAYYTSLHQLNYAATPLGSEWFPAWLEKDVKPRVKASTYASYFYKMKNYIIPYIGNIHLGELSNGDFQQLLVTLTQEKRLSSATVKVVFVLIKKSMNTAIQAGYIQEDPSKDVQLPKKSNKKVSSLTREQQKKLEEAAIDDPWGLTILLALYTGLRIGELAGLRWQDVDLNEKIIRVRKTYQRIADPATGKTTLVLGDAKTDFSERIVPFSSQLQKWLIEWRQSSAICGATYVFEKKNKPVEPRLISHHFKRIAKKVGCESCNFHQLRHTFATRCLEANGDVVSVSTMLGHTSAKTTLDTYVDSLLEERRKIIDAIEHMF